MMSQKKHIQSQTSVKQLKQHQSGAQYVQQILELWIKAISYLVW